MSPSVLPLLSLSVAILGGCTVLHAYRTDRGVFHYWVGSSQAAIGLWLAVLETGRYPPRFEPWLLLFGAGLFTVLFGTGAVLVGRSLANVRAQLR